MTNLVVSLLALIAITLLFLAIPLGASLFGIRLGQLWLDFVNSPADAQDDELNKLQKIRLIRLLLMVASGIVLLFMYFSLR